MSMPGLAGERTRLAWRRTALGLAAGSVAAARLLQDVLGPASWAIAVAGLIACALVVRHHTSDVPQGEQAGRLVTIVALGTSLIGVAALVVVLTGPARLS